MPEAKLNCKYSLFTHICHSRVGVIQKIKRTEFLNRIKMHSSVIIKTVKDKLTFSTLRLVDLFKTHKILLPLKYENLNIDFNVVDEEPEEIIEEVE